MRKIVAEHLGRQAIVYVRQSTQDQLLHNHESRRRQYGLVDRARQLGWAEPVVIDDDLGRSGGGVARPGVPERPAARGGSPGFERLLLAICEGRVGPVLGHRAGSRGLAAGTQRARLAQAARVLGQSSGAAFCGLVGCLLADEDGVYDPRLANDRLLLGMKGTMSEMELSLLRQRSLEALRQKARRGELFLSVAVGYVKVGRNRIDKDPDLRVQEAIGLVFRKFAEFGSIRQVHLWLRQEQVLLPSVETAGELRRIVWGGSPGSCRSTTACAGCRPTHGGAYAFGRTASRVTVENGRKRVSRGHDCNRKEWRDREEWDVLIVDHHTAVGCGVPPS